YYFGDSTAICGHDLAQILGIKPRRERGRADQVAKQHGYCRRAAEGVSITSRPTLAGGSKPPSRRKAAIAVSNLRRCPTRVTPMSLKSSAVSSDSTAASIA